MDEQRRGQTGFQQAPSKVIAIDELSGCLQVSKSFLNKPAQKRMVPSQKVGWHWLFHKAAIDAWPINDDGLQRGQMTQTSWGGDDR